MGWSYKHAKQQQSGRDDAGAGAGGRGGAGASNADRMEKLFQAQNYGILSRSQVQKAIDRNNKAHLAELPRIVAAFHLPPKTAYDAEVVQRIAEFQQNFFRRENAGGVDGIVGGRTLKLLTSYYDRKDPGEVDTSALWPPAGASIEQQFDHYAHIASLFGHAPKKGEPLLIGIRGVMEFAGASHEFRQINSYDDTYVLLYEDDQGRGVSTFAGATHAYQAASRLSPNADGRGGGDVGSIRPTHDGQSYELKPRGRYHGRKSLGVESDPTEWGAARKPSWWQLGTVPAHRDTNHDRRISDAEKKASETRRRGQQVLPGLGDYANVTWFHPGFTEKKDNGRPFASIACLTAREEDVDNLVAVSQTAKSPIRFIVVEAAEVMKRLGRSPQPARPRGEQAAGR